MKQLKDYIKRNGYQRAFIIIKPGFIDKGKEIIDLFNENGWEIEKMRIKRLQPVEAEKLYEPHKQEEWFKPLCDYMCSGICQGIILKKPSNNKSFNDVKKLKDEIREKYGESDMRNVLHSSDSYERFDIESHIFF